MQADLYIALWAYLFTMPLSEPGQVFGWIKGVLNRLLKPENEGFGEALFKVLIACPKCHAGQIALWWQVYCFIQYSEFSLPFILIAIAGAYFLQTWHLIVDKWLNK